MDGPRRAGWQPLPAGTEPMLATAGSLPPVADDAEWAYEMKWDGVRALLRADRGRIAVLSRNHRDITVSYPELKGLGEQLGRIQAVLDGEIVAFDDGGRPSFGRLQQRMHVAGAGAARRLADSVPATYLIFDLLHLDGRSLISLSYAERRELLEGLELGGPSWQTPAAFTGGGADALRTSQEQGLEGVMAKRLGSRYLPGRRSPDWVKIKNIRAQEVVIGGWRPGNGRRAGTIGALLIGLPGPDGLSYAGRVGTGFSDAVLATLLERLERLASSTCPFGPDFPPGDARDARWVSPRLVGEVSFTNWTADGRLRHPAWRGLRPDKAPAQVVREGCSAKAARRRLIGGG
ncbi:MAG TPA: non-homologous end-joining DNA ligase [Jatrophihabitantaceae bacterium]|nr:non-homologous end-joining DNA ligase [Jatrophihabitantaceae bacterium]